MRWRIAENKRRIESENFENHFDDVEMSGERISAIVGYGAEQGAVRCEVRLVFPWIRLQPDVTTSSYQFACPHAKILREGSEKFIRVSFDGFAISLSTPLLVGGYARTLRIFQSSRPGRRISPGSFKIGGLSLD